MDQVHIRESNSEIIIFLDYNHSTPLAALEEAAKILAREVLRIRKNIDYQKEER